MEGRALSALLFHIKRKKGTESRRKGDRQIMLDRLSVSAVVVGDVTDVN